MNTVTIGISVIAILTGGAAAGFYAFWRHAEDMGRYFLADALKYRDERDSARADYDFLADQHKELTGAYRAAQDELAVVLAKDATRRAKLSAAGSKGAAVSNAKRRAA
jgi:hypothetical protein